MTGRIAVELSKTQRAINGLCAASLLLFAGVLLESFAQIAPTYLRVLAQGGDGLSATSLAIAAWLMVLMTGKFAASYAANQLAVRAVAGWSDSRPGARP
ncbi:hypothetical protein [Caulobacter sp. RHG1]|uniref:hypothetical protein n=1 Tax=Caulobacter sp. (strain RHG1) TaxID=2545762 RepID=UPI00155391C3|nr:hypothetical protein [Caulobacter sp. RHG1]NQE61395.1 hypothetical protein [Caulobacter sp. RHG1]